MGEASGGNVSLMGVCLSPGFGDTECAYGTKPPWLPSCLCPWSKSSSSWSLVPYLIVLPSLSYVHLLQLESQDLKASETSEFATRLRTKLASSPSSRRQPETFDQ